jgi:hypothetical protein
MVLFLILLRLLIGAPQNPPAFTAQTVDSAISIGYGLAIADVDGDKKDDILLADKKQIVWYRNPDWKKTVIAEHLTQFDNVCIAARDVDGDGKAEVAVGAQWNPSETTNDSLSGAVFYLQRPADEKQLWKPVKLHHEPTVHRMRWVKTSDNKQYLVVLPLHGRGNKSGEGAGVKVLAYEFPKDVNSNWRIDTISNDMHMTHNMHVVEKEGAKTKIYIAGREGIQILLEPFTSKEKAAVSIRGSEHASGEIKVSGNMIATIQPMHGNSVSIYSMAGEKTNIDTTLHEGHALGLADFAGSGSLQVVAGWRNPNKDNKVGVKLYSYSNNAWRSSWVDEDGMACEDLQVADLDGNGKPDIIAAGRATKNVKIYWNN